MPRLRVAFWNVENLFEAGVNARRGPQSAPELSAKVARVTSVLRGLGSPPDPPALIGLAEVATERLVKRIARNLVPTDPTRFGYTWAPAKDSALDTGLVLLVDTKVIHSCSFISLQSPQHSRPHVLWTKCGIRGVAAALFVSVNHWKSRMADHGDAGGARRAQSAQWLEGTIASIDRDVQVVALGDFNDEPFDQSLRVALRAKRSHAGVFEANSKGRLYNTAWQWLSEPDHYTAKNAAGYAPSRSQRTYGDSGEPAVFDHILVSRALLGGGSLTLDEASVHVRAEPGIAQQQRFGRIAPLRWSWDDATGTGQGASDHFPVVADLVH